MQYLRALLKTPFRETILNLFPLPEVALGAKTITSNSDTTVATNRVTGKSANHFRFNLWETKKRLGNILSIVKRIFWETKEILRNPFWGTAELLGNLLSLPGRPFWGMKELLKNLISLQSPRTQNIPSMAIFFLLPFILSFILPEVSKALHINAVVAQDGSGDYKTIGEAIQAAPNFSVHRYTIFIKGGLYREILLVGPEKSNITFVGEGRELTVISGSKVGFVGDTATLGVDGFGFFATNLTIENTGDPRQGPGVALRSNSPQAAYYRCSIKGHQDTVFIQLGPQFYRNCWIHGTIDFIFGNGPAVFQGCHILAREALFGQANALTANGRESQDDPSGFSFHLCNISGDVALKGSKIPTRTYLGRPWRAYARTVFIESYMSNVIMPAGWLRWNKSFEATLFYGEFRNKGQGARVNNRVKWPGVHAVLDAEVAKRFTVSSFIQGEKWLPAIGVPFVAGLTLEKAAVSASKSFSTFVVLLLLQLFCSESFYYLLASNLWRWREDMKIEAFDHHVGFLRICD
ncbi:hypothetical protein K2173_016015 [Erythroxylum novogranatense]|uniref:Pectinesterase n=1 Tax=Erythroxylum novogranatense TaxID=1862640 RepID=A0AAV8SFA4_9ROSI|nr:hypothetical protein K2173_016015 [Erythroxylum novogranatense]